MTRDDFGLLGDWFSRPHIARWWREPYDPAAIEARYGPPVDGAEPTELFIIEVATGPVGFIQWYRLDDNPEWRAALAPAGVPDRAAGIDYLLGEPELIGRGLGPALIQRFLSDRGRAHPDVEAVVVNIDPENRRSWRAVEKVGFRRVWEGDIQSDDPSDNGPSYVYVWIRPDGDV